ncbi:MAG: hypothetical protein V7L20_16670 [Nostoc sp.]
MSNSSTVKATMILTASSVHRGRLRLDVKVRQIEKELNGVNIVTKLNRNLDSL